ncbi:MULTISPECIES: hypothetical protein [unclassified Streptomyces]|uniref:hypothetical protein n=1 Tax=unclassified Streptomyces TaxID=2593676 RepID=UPI0004CB9D34|nr:hypothetical protein [Streptomyces sp. NRRL F-5727]
MRANRKLWATATICLAVVAGVSGCGKGDDKPADPFAGLSADAIADKAVEATKSATAFRMNGNGTDEGVAMKVDFAVDDKGNCKGSMESGKGGKAEIVGTGGTSYMKGDDAFWKSSSGEEGSSDEEAGAISTLLKGRWMKMPAGEEGPGAFCDLKSITKDMDEDTPRKGMTREADADVDGTPAVVLKGKADSKGETSTLYVAKDSAKPYILRVVTTGGDEPGTVTLADYDKPVTVTAPPADQVVDMEQLMKAGAGS